MLRYLAAVMPPEEITKRIVEFGESHTNQEVRGSQHPNIKAIFREGMDFYLNWENVVSQVAAETKPFEIKLGRPQFISNYVLAIPIEAPELEAIHTKSVEIMHKEDKREVSPESLDETEHFFESQSRFVPYLTIATGVFGHQNFLGINREKRRILKQAQAQLGNLPAFTANELTLYEAAVFDRSYEVKGTIPLGKPGTLIQPAPAGLQPLTI